MDGEGVSGCQQNGSLPTARLTRLDWLGDPVDGGTGAGGGGGGGAERQEREHSAGPHAGKFRRAQDVAARARGAARSMVLPAAALLRY